METTGDLSLHVNWYVAVNLVEAMIWFGCGNYFGWKAHQLKPVLWFRPALAVTFVVFGCSDLAECVIDGPLPRWLWAWKIGGGLALFGFLIVEDYHERGRIALAPHRFVAATAILVIALFCIIHQK